MKKHLLFVILGLSTSLLFAQKTKKTPQGEAYYFVEDVKGTNAVEGDYIYYTRQEYNQKGKLVDQIFEEEELVGKNSFFTLVSVGDKAVKTECISEAVVGDKAPQEYCYKVLFVIKKIVTKNEIEAFIQARIDENEKEIAEFMKAYKPEDIHFYPEGAYYSVRTKVGSGEKPKLGTSVRFEFENVKTGEVNMKEKTVSNKIKYAFLADMQKGEEVVLLVSYKSIPIEERIFLFTQKEADIPRMKARLVEINVELAPVEDYYSEEAPAVIESTSEFDAEYEDSTIESEITK